MALAAGLAVLPYKRPGFTAIPVSWVAWRPVTLPGWTPPAWLKLEAIPPGKTQFDLLACGAIDAGISTEIRAPGRHRARRSVSAHRGRTGLSAGACAQP